MRRITLIAVGPNGIGRDLDLLATVMSDLAKRPKGTAFEVPTTWPSRLLGDYGDRFQVWPLGVRLCDGSFGPVGIQSLASVSRTDLTMLVGEVGGCGFWSVFRLFGVSLLLQAARRAGRPVTAFAVRLGPFRGSLARKAARRCLLACSEISVRDEASEREADALGIVVSSFADSA